VYSGYFVLNSHNIPGTGFDIFAGSGLPSQVDWVGTTPITEGADAGASDLIPIGGSTHPVSPNEEITVIINIRDEGDSLFDTAAYIDNLMFSGYAKTDIIARNYAIDQNGGLVQSNDIIEYVITMSNLGLVDQQNNDGNEFENSIPNNSTLVNNSLIASSGFVDYNSNQNMIIWNGEIPAESSVSIQYSVQVNDSMLNGSLLRNQGFVYWDSDEDSINDAIEYTDDPHVDNGIDEDGDDETDDDDPTDLIITTFEPTNYVKEDFIDDYDGLNASDYYLGRLWFETTKEDVISNFEVVDCYHNKSAKAFKTQLRAIGGEQYWYYNIPNLEGVMNSWQISFRCSNATEESLIGLDFYNSDNDLIAKLKFEYIQAGTTPPVDWLIVLYYWSPSHNSWKQLFSDRDGYLYNDWYTLKIEIMNEYHLKYYLYREGVGLVGTREDLGMDPLLTEYIPGSINSNLAYIKWYNTFNPVVCPMIIWDDHYIELITS
jgi:hypothetical protein